MPDDIIDDRLELLEEENASLRRAILLLHRIASLVQGAIELDPTCYALLTGVTAGVGLGLNRAMLFLGDETDRDVLRGTAAVGPASPEEADRVWRSIESSAPDLETLYEAGLAQREHPGRLDQLVRTVRVNVSSDTPIAIALREGVAIQGAGNDDLEGLLHLPTAVAAPLQVRSGIRGVLYGDSIYTGRCLTSTSLQVLSLLADQAGLALENAHQFEQIAHQARTDALTGLAHHGALMEELGQATNLAEHNGSSLGVIMVDLDDFKRVNDSHGHLIGDALLAGVAARLRSVLRTDESPYRYGGEEFTVVLPGADLAAAAAVGERVRSAVSERSFATGCAEPTWITCSVGVASYPDDGDGVQAVVAAADAALLRAKALGKNRVERAGG